VDHSLRLYTNPFKQSLYLLGSLGFVAVGLLLFLDPKFRANTANVIGDYFVIGFFGWCSVIFLYSMARDLLVRRPVLQVDAQGWTFNPALGLDPQRVPWQDIGRIALFRQRANSTRMLYLVLEARHPDQLPPSRVRGITARFYPSMSRAVMTVPLNTAFMRASPAKVERLLHRIQAEFSSEIDNYGIEVVDTMQDM